MSWKINLEWLEELRLQPRMFTIVKLIWPKMARFDMLIRDMMLP